MYTVCSLRTYKIQHKVNTRKPLIEPQKLVFYKLFQYFIHNVSNTYQEHESTDEEGEKEQHGVHRGNLQLSEGCRHHVKHQLYAYKRTDSIVTSCNIKDIVGPYKCLYPVWLLQLYIHYILECNLGYSQVYKKTESITMLCIIKDIVWPCKWSKPNTSWYDYYRPKSIVSLSVT